MSRVRVCSATRPQACCTCCWRRTSVAESQHARQPTSSNSARGPPRCRREEGLQGPLCFAAVCSLVDGRAGGRAGGWAGGRAVGEHDAGGLDVGAAVAVSYVGARGSKSKSKNKSKRSSMDMPRARAARGRPTWDSTERVEGEGAETRRRGGAGNTTDASASTHSQSEALRRQRKRIDLKGMEKGAGNALMEREHETPDPLTKRVKKAGGRREGKLRGCISTASRAA